MALKFLAESTPRVTKMPPHIGNPGLEGSSCQQKHGAERDHRNAEPLRCQPEAAAALPWPQVSGGDEERLNLPLSRPPKMVCSAMNNTPPRTSSAPSEITSMPASSAPSHSRSGSIQTETLPAASSECECGRRSMRCRDRCPRNRLADCRCSGARQAKIGPPGWCPNGQRLIGPRGRASAPAAARPQRRSLTVAVALVAND